jgi:protein-S-isoprenylcysteine O-methyltransferase Ste14
MDQDRPNIVVIPPLPFFVSVILTFVLGRWISLELLIAVPRSLLLVVGISVMILALWINITGFLAFRRAETNVNPYQPALIIVRDGPFRFTRNPMYLGMILFAAGFGIALATLWGPILAFGLWVLLHWGVVLREELYLKEKFGAAYDELLTATRRWL